MAGVYIYIYIYIYTNKFGHKHVAIFDSEYVTPLEVASISQVEGEA